MTSSDDPLNLSSDSLYLNRVTKKDKKWNVKKARRKKTRRKLKRSKCGNKRRRKTSLVPLSAAGDCNKLGEEKKKWFHLDTCAYIHIKPLPHGCKAKDFNICFSPFTFNPFCTYKHIMKYLRTKSPSDLSLSQLKILWNVRLLSISRKYYIQ